MFDRGPDLGGAIGIADMVAETRLEDSGGGATGRQPAGAGQATAPGKRSASGRSVAMPGSGG